MKKDLFINSKRYRVKVDFSCGGTDFIKDECLDFVCGAYSRYDDCYIYEFKDIHGNAKNWILSADADGGAWTDLFDPLP
jgi:hypothetical protein